MNKKIIIIVFVLIGIVILLFLFLPSTTKQQETPKPSVTQIPTPTIFIPQENTNTLDGQLRIQTQADKKFSEWQKDINTKYPWYNDLPLQENEYYIYFDLDKTAFVTFLYPKQSGNISIETQITKLKEKILKQLTMIGVDTKNYQFFWTIQPK